MISNKSGSVIVYTSSRVICVQYQSDYFMKFYHSTLWLYGLSSFQAGGTKLERFLPKNQCTQGKLLNFENWFSGELSKIGHHFTNKLI